MAGHYVEITIKVIERDKKRSTEFKSQDNVIDQSKR